MSVVDAFYLSNDLDTKYCELILNRCQSGDPEKNDCELEEVICQLLKELGLSNTLREFKNVERYYR